MGTAKVMDGYGMEEMYGEVLTGQGNGTGLMTNLSAVITITVVVLAVSILIGVILAKKRIKKGFDLYED